MRRLVAAIVVKNPSFILISFERGATARPQSGGLGVAKKGEREVETDESGAVVVLEPVEVAGVDPFLERRAIEVGDDLKVFERDHFGFAAAEGALVADGVAAAQKEERVGFDGDFCLPGHSGLVSGVVRWPKRGQSAQDGGRKSFRGV